MTVVIAAQTLDSVHTLASADSMRNVLSRLTKIRKTDQRERAKKEPNAAFVGTHLSSISSSLSLVIPQSTYSYPQLLSQRRNCSYVSFIVVVQQLINLPAESRG